MKILVVFLMIVIIFPFTGISSLAEEDSKSLKRTIVINKKQKYSALAISRVDFNNYQTKKGDKFCARLVEDVKTESCMIVPKGSVISGKVAKVDIPKRFPSRDGAINFTINQIVMPNGYTLSLSDRNIKGIILSPYRKGYYEKFLERTPVSIIYYAVNIPIDTATDLAGGVVYAISMAGAMVAGAITGFLDPDVGRTRENTALLRAINSTPVGTVRMVVANGLEASLKTGDGVIIRFENNTLKKLVEEQGMNCVIAKK